ncbi:MAG: hypothetical protein U9R57_11145 [Thermodesulfobacteriota bacterium]|nr:hypothetical protein [Thermodesulfobacteriota bacterium]
MPDSQTEKLLILSVKQYGELLQHAEALSKMLDDCDYSQVEQYLHSLRQLQATASRQDELLLSLLKADLAAWEENTRYQMRQNYIHSILKLNESLVPKIRGILAVTAVELKKIRGGRTALAGYAFKVPKQRKYRSIG